MRGHLRSKVKPYEQSALYLQHVTRYKGLVFSCERALVLLPPKFYEKSGRPQNHFHYVLVEHKVKTVILQTHEECSDLQVKPISWRELWLRNRKSYLTASKYDFRTHPEFAHHHSSVLKHLMLTLLRELCVLRVGSVLKTQQYPA